MVKKECWFCAHAKVFMTGPYDMNIDCKKDCDAFVFSGAHAAEDCELYSEGAPTKTNKNEGKSGRMNIKLTFQGQPMEVEVTCDFRKSKYIVAGTVKRIDIPNQKGVFYLWDCTPIQHISGDMVKKYEQPMLLCGKKSIPKEDKDKLTHFVMHALKMYKIERSKAKSQIAAMKTPVSKDIPDGFEPVDGGEMFGKC